MSHIVFLPWCALRIHLSKGACWFLTGWIQRNHIIGCTFVLDFNLLLKKYFDCSSINLECYNVLKFDLFFIYSLSVTSSSTDECVSKRKGIKFILKRKYFYHKDYPDYKKRIDKHIRLTTVIFKFYHMTEAGDPMRSTAPAWNHCTAKRGLHQTKIFFSVKK